MRKGTLIASLCWIAHLASFAALGKGIHSFAGPFIIYISAVNDCKDVNSPIVTHRTRFSHFNPRRPFDKQTLSGNITVPVPIDDTWWGSITLDIRSNNQWKSNAFIFNITQHFCSAMRKNVPGYFHAAFGLDPNSKAPCLIPNGTHTFKDEPVSWDPPNVPIMPYGFYRSHNVGGVGRHMHACYLTECHIIPKPT
ncbi:uncharacterized protein LOC127751044 [Frankliniella occidentalis]|uniref:Uncharacterized protein LOC127751044 n=1 Tax=Frankliniella occidentalis TaxID=133901 RepID=A0A9C6X677_FRAOC|nr:uncharacterized protein LOC127751044 [Frankliniella occidentalis]